MAHDVLISYSTHDKLQADAICNRLESQGIRCWIAPRDVPLGTEYADSIVQAIESAQVMVLIYSTHADESHQVRREVERAVSNGITIIPVRIENRAMSDAFQYYVGSMHWLDAITPPFEQHIDKLAHDLKALLSKDGKGSAEATGQGRAGERAPAGRNQEGTTERKAPGASEALRPTTGPADAPPSGRRRTVIAAAAIVVLAGVGAAGYFIFLGPERSVTVPAVLGMSQREATEKLEAAELKVAKVVEVENADLDYPNAVRTVPEAGQASARNGDVTLYVSGMDVLPDLTESSESDARARLDKLGFHTVQVRPTASAKNEGTVLAMEPRPGSRVLRGKPVSLSVAGQKVAVPDLLRKPLADAQRQATDASLKVKVVKDWNKDVKPDVVFNMDPAAGTNANPGDSLTLYVSAAGGWVYPEEARQLAVDQTFRMSRDRNLRASPSNSSQKLGTVPKGKTVKVLEAPGDGWAKVVLLD
jgi:beta-lactam-binding protein with PASTA domain